MDDIGVSWHPCHHIGTTVHVASDGVYAGHIVISDKIKEDSADAVKELKKRALEKRLCLRATLRRSASVFLRSLV